MSNSISIVAGLFLMLSVASVLFIGVGYLIGIDANLLAPYSKIVGLVLAISVLVGLYDNRVFKNAWHWLGLW
jgi:hypothetical protein